MTTWRDLIENEMKLNNEKWDDVVHLVFERGDLDTEFDSGYGVATGSPFLLWTETSVYFPVVYDGAEWVGSVSRFPTNIPLGHFGGQ